MNAVAVYGGFVVLFGAIVGVMQTGWFGPVGEDFSQVNWVALIVASIALAGTGATDEVSAIFRSSMMLTIVPDEMRGRLQGVFFAIVTGGPRLGDIYAGFLAGLTVLWFPPILGGILIAVIVATTLRVTPALKNYVVEYGKG